MTVVLAVMHLLNNNDNNNDNVLSAYREVRPYSADCGRASADGVGAGTLDHAGGRRLDQKGNLLGTLAPATNRNLKNKQPD